MRRPTIKRCVPCSKKRHSQCTGLSATNDGRPCPCCRDLTPDQRQAKEKEFKDQQSQKRYEELYEYHASTFDRHVYELRKKHQLERDASALEFLPTDPKGIRALARELEMSVNWLEKFLNEHRQDLDSEY